MRGLEFSYRSDKELEELEKMLALFFAPSLAEVLRFYISCRPCPVLILRASSTAIDKTLLQMQSFAQKCGVSNALTWFQLNSPGNIEYDQC